MHQKQYLKRANSKESLSTYTYNTKVATVYPDFSFEAVQKMIDDDPIARGAINHYVDKFMEGDINIIERATFKYRPREELILQEKYMFRTNILRKSALLIKLFNNVFIENVKDADNNVIGLNILDSTNIDPITAPNGDPLSYRTKVPDKKTGQYITWDKKEITWIKMGDRTKGFAPVDMKALWENLVSKSALKQYITWLWKTGQYRLFINPRNATEQSIQDFIAYARKNDNNFTKPFFVKGEIETKILRDMKEQQYVPDLIKMYDEQTLILLRVPPSDAGKPDASGRSNADAQSNNFNTHVTSVKKLIEDAINFDLFPKINRGNTLFRFAPIDRFAEKSVFENLQIMQSLGMTQEAMQEYMQDRGLFYTATLFNKPEEMLQTDNPRDKDTMPSRTGKGTGEGNEPQDTVTTRQDQIKKE